MNQSPRLARALPRSRAAVVTAIALILIALGAVWASVALALPPGGPAENRGTASIKLTSTVIKPVDANDATTGLVKFTGTGFTAGEVLLVKIDDGAVAPDTARRPQPPSGVTPQSNDWLAIGVADANGDVPETDVDLRNVVAGDAAKVTAGKHLLRFVSSQPRSIHADFIVRPAITTGVPNPNAPATAVIGPAADQPVAWLADHAWDDIPSLVPGSLVPYRLTGFAGNQVISVKIDNGASQAGNTYNPPAPLPSPLNPGASLPADVWDSFRADASGNAQGLLRIPTDAARAGGHIVRFLGAANAEATPPVAGRSVWAPFAIDGSAADRTVTLAASGQRGRSVALTGSGLRKTAFYLSNGTGNTGDGQTITARIDGTGTPFSVRANDDGTLSSALPIPADTALGTHNVVVWIGFRAGSDFPQKVLEQSFEVTEPVPVGDVPGGDVPTTPPTGTIPTTPSARARAAKVSSKSLKASKKGRVSLTLLRPSVAGKATVSVTSKRRIRLKGATRAKILTLVKRATFSLKAGTAKQTTVLSLRLTKEARSHIRRVRSLKVVVKVAPKGAKAFTKTLTLR